MKNNLIQDLKSALPTDAVLDSPESLICYSTDATRLPGRPSVVVRPSDSAQIVEIMKVASANNAPVVPRGAGTGLSGGCVPSQGGVVVSTERLTGIIEIDPVDMVAVVEPGLVTARLHEAVEAVGLFYPPDPASFKACTIGGNIAENAGGLRGLKYGVTRDYVMGLSTALATGGSLVSGGRSIKNVTGYDMTRLFTGSEGTLGFMTRAILRLVPKPEAKVAFLAAYADMELASKAVVAVLTSGVVPSTLEIMDEITLKAVNGYLGRKNAPEYGALVLIEVDGSDTDVARQAARLETVLGSSGAVELRRAADEAEHNALWAARRAALSALARISPSVVLEDATVPRKRIPDMVRAIRKIAEGHALLIGTFGHAGDGNLHPTIVTDLRIKENADRTHAAVDAIFKAALSLGGTLSGEHGIGLAKARYMTDEFGAEGVAAMKAVKAALDPKGLMNPGKMFE